MGLDSFYETYNEISKSLLYDIITDKEDENAVISPMSIIALLGIAAASTEDDTSDEIVRFIKADSKEELLYWVSEMIKIIMASDSTELANVVIASEKIKDSIKPEYKDKIGKFFDAAVISSSNIVKEVNSWVNKKTKGMISNIADDSMSDMLAALLNAITFISDWREKYEADDIGSDEYTNYDGTICETAMLYSSEKRYVENEFYTGFIKAYKDNDFEFMALLPKKKKSKSFFKKAFISSELSDLYKNAQHIKVNTVMPEFKTDYTENLTAFLERNGIKNIFTDSADFSPMATNTSLKIDSVLHKAHIEVTRRGTKAAAVSFAYVVAGAAVMMEETKEVILDRPFIYAVMNKKTGLPVFVGTVKNLT